MGRHASNVENHWFKGSQFIFTFVVAGKLGCHSPGSRGGSDPSGGSSSGPPGGHQVDLHVMYSAFRSQHHTPSVGELKVYF